VKPEVEKLMMVSRVSTCRSWWTLGVGDNWEEAH
jgi:hypothetical protein